MSGFEAVAATAALTAASSALSAGAQQSQAKAQNEYQRQLAEQRNQAAAIEVQRRERDRQNLLAKAQASQRARLGALGIGSTGGSGDALLRGLEMQASQQRADDLQDYSAGAGLRAQMAPSQSPWAAAALGATQSVLRSNAAENWLTSVLTPAPKKLPVE